MKPKRMKNVETKATSRAKMRCAKSERARCAVGEPVKGAVAVRVERRKRGASCGGQIEKDRRGGALMGSEDV